MAHKFIKDLGPGEMISDQVFLISSKDLRTTTNGSLYIHAVLADKTGQVPARIWQASEAQYKVMPEGGFLRIKGRTESYKGHLQMIIEGMFAVKEGEFDVANFLPTTQQNVDEMWEKVKVLLRAIKDADLLHLMKSFVEDADSVAMFKRAPAAMSMHHAYLGGLLEHTLNLLEIAQLVIPRYPELSLDLVLAGIFLHDLGKTRELKYETNFGYTDEGQLLGHITQCILMIEEKIRQAEQTSGRKFPPEKKWVLQHIVLSHHGEYEFGSPKLPAVPEAIAVHYLDNLDAKIYQALHAITTDNDEQADWTGFLQSLGTKLYKRDVVPEGN